MNGNVEETNIKNDQDYNDNTQSKQQSGLFYQLLICALVNINVLGPSTGFGYSAVILPTLRSGKVKELHINDQQASWIASAMAISIPLGCIMSGLVLRLGRKPSLLITSSVSLISWLTIYFSNTYNQIVIGRIFSGIAIGLASISATTYCAEVTSPKLRNTALTWSSIVIALGVLIVYIFGYIFPDNWDIVALLCAVFPATAIISTLSFVPETPMWLKEHGRLDEAVKILKKFNGLSENQSLSSELKAQILPRTIKCPRDKNIFKNLQSHRAIKPLIIMICFFFFQQFSGIFAITYYAVDIANDAGIRIDGYLTAILIGLTRLLGSILIALVSNKFGRRFPAITSGAGMTIFLSVLSAYLILETYNYSIPDSGIIPAICIIMYIFTSSIGFATIPFAMVCEIFPSSIKDILSCISTCFAYVFSFITVKIYPQMCKTVGKHGTFFFYAIMCFLGTLFVIIFVPETKGKTLMEIEELFKRKREQKQNIVENGKTEIDKDNTIPLKNLINTS